MSDSEVREEEGERGAAGYQNNSHGIFSQRSELGQGSGHEIDREIFESNLSQFSFSEALDNSEGQASLSQDAIAFEEAIEQLGNRVNILREQRNGNTSPRNSLGNQEAKTDTAQNKKRKSLETPTNCLSNEEFARNRFVMIRRMFGTGANESEQEQCSSGGENKQNSSADDGDAKQSDAQPKRRRGRKRKSEKEEVGDRKKRACKYKGVTLEEVVNLYNEAMHNPDRTEARRLCNKYAALKSRITREDEFNALKEHVRMSTRALKEIIESYNVLVNEISVYMGMDSEGTNTAQESSEVGSLNTVQEQGKETDAALAKEKEAASNRIHHTIGKMQCLIHSTTEELYLKGLKI